jgi:hypothetical protein
MRTRTFWIFLVLTCVLVAAAVLLILAPPWTWRSRRYNYERAQRDNAPIEFYGKVVEQDGTPIAGATIDLTISRLKPHLLSDKDPHSWQTFQKVTDENGCFSVNEDKGLFLEVKRISKDGYRSDLKVTPFFHYSATYSTSPKHHPDASKPVFFYMWKKGPAESLIERKRVFRVRVDNSPITIDLLTGKSPPGRVNVGDLQVSLKRPEGLLYPTGIYDWEFEIKAVNGGIVETSEVFPYQAPETGYKGSYKYALSTAIVEGGYTAKKKYYVRGRDGTFFASLEVVANSNADTSGEAWGAFSIDYRLNRRGSRNLEPGSPKLNP